VNAEVAEAAPARAALGRLLNPQSIAVVGASVEPRSIARLILSNIAAFAPRSTVHLVSRSRSEIDGTPCVPHIRDLPRGIDVAVLCLPEAAISEALVACSERDIGSAIVFASGFAETGDEGRLKQLEISAIARESGMLLLGPNCMGLVNSVNSVALAINEIAPDPVPTSPAIAIAAQSGSIMFNIANAVRALGQPVSYAVATGNEALLGLEDFAEYFLEDEITRTVVLFAEELRKPQKLLRLAKRACSLGKPIVLMHTGRSQRAQIAAASHTGALTGDYRTMQACVREHGIVMVETFDELFDVAALLNRNPEPPLGDGVAIVTNSGAFCGYALDLCERFGVNLAQLTTATRERLRDVLPSTLSVNDVIDIGTSGRQQPSIYGEAARILLSDPNVAGLVVAMGGGSSRQQLVKATNLLPAVLESTKPVAFTIWGDRWPLDTEFLDVVSSAGVPLFRSPERALRAMKAITTRRRESMPRDATPAPIARSHSASLPFGNLPEHRGKALLASIGIGIPRGELVRDLWTATAVAEQLGYPVVLKAQSQHLPHKTECGGVILNVPDAETLRTSWQRLHANIATARPDLQLDGVLVEKMAEPGLELIVAARHDPRWGNVLVLGLGGIFTELLDDVCILPAAIGAERIVEGMLQLTGARALQGWRGAGPVDLQAVAETALRLAQLLNDQRSITEVEINPLLAYPDGCGVMALDVLIHVGAANGSEV
jgi:acetate---CoA ligase (ADP-forming)